MISLRKSGNLAPLSQMHLYIDRVNQSAKVYVSGDVHTNTIEGFWSLVKRKIDGSYHSVSAKHLQGYLNENAWRYNYLDDGRAMFELALLRAASR